MTQIRWAVAVHSPVRQRLVSQRISGLTPASAAYELDAQPGTFTVSGVAASTVRDIAINAAATSYAVTGVDATFARTFSVDSQPGTFAVTGVAAGLLSDRVVDAQPGVFTLNGADVTFTLTKEINAEPGTYAVTGGDATLEFTAGPAAPPNVALRAIVAHTPKQRARVSVAISGLAPAQAYELNAEPGTYAVSGLAASLETSTPLIWDKVVSPNYAHTTAQIMYGTRMFAGVEVIAPGAYELNAQPATYSVSGAAASVVAGRAISADPASYTLTGVAATLISTRALSADPAAYTITGTSATTVSTRVLSADPVVYTLTGADAGLNLDTPGAYTLTAEIGSFAVTGAAATVVSTRVLSADPGGFGVTGFSATVGRELSITASPASYTVTGAAAEFLRALVLSANTGGFTVTGAPTGFQVEGREPNLDAILTGWLATPTVGRIGGGTTGRIRTPQTGSIA